MTRRCGCSGPGEPSSQPDSQGQCGGLSRRSFLRATGTGAAGLLMPSAAIIGAPSLAAAVSPEATLSDPASPRPSPPDLKTWQSTLLTDRAPRIYRSDIHTDARMHMGGLGTGNIELGVDGRFTGWNVFNTLQEGEVPLHFALYAGGQSRLLQTTAGPDGSHIPLITMRGEYPIADLEFHDESLPVKVSLQAMTPLVPMDERASSAPAIHLEFSLKNDSDTAQPAAIAGMMLNPVGYEGAGEIRANRHAALGGNKNRYLASGEQNSLEMLAEPMDSRRLQHPVVVFVDRGVDDGPWRRHLPPGLRFRPLSDLPAASKSAGRSPQTTVIWLDSPDPGLPVSILDAARNAARAGATVLVSGRSSALFTAYAAWIGSQGEREAQPAGDSSPDIVIADFESGTYNGWTVEGTAFGKRPSRGTEPNQQPVAGFQGQYLVNSYPGSDEPQGRLLSKPFRVERRFIRFLVGGGSSPETSIRLLIDGKVRRTTSGKDREELEPTFWDVADLRGETARIEIIDHASGGWGHINVDFVVMADSPVDARLLNRFSELMPARFTSVENDASAVTIPLTGPGLASSGLPAAISLAGGTRFGGFELADGASTLVEQDGHPLLVVRPVGRGRVMLAAGEPAFWRDDSRPSAARQRTAEFLAALGGSPAPPTGGQIAEAPGFGTFALCTKGTDVTAAARADTMDDLWHRFSAGGRFDALEDGFTTAPSPAGQSTFCGLAVSVTVPPHSTVKIPFVLAWRLPNFYNESGEPVGNYYSSLWPSALAAAHDLLHDRNRSVARALAFRDAMYNSTLPYWLLDCLTSQMSTIRHIGVVFRTGDGGIYGWEGSNGCCQPTCTHVWGYEQTLSRVFPALERKMRFVDFRCQQESDGGIHNRTVWPAPAHPTGEQPFADGHASCILKAYRESLNSHDGAWLAGYWPEIKKAVEYLVGRDAAGGVPDGILEDAQFNTYDDAVHGPNSFIGGYYLAALRAGEEMAVRVGERATAARWRALFESGRRRLVELCWNGDYFEQNLPDYQSRAGEYGPGCMADQLIGQWWAHLLGLGYILPQEKVRRALSSIFAHNWLPDMSQWRHHQRAFAGGTDRGLLICSWPHGGRPAQPIPYVDEVWTGVEYEVAALMIEEGMIDEGLSIARGARDRYDGVPRPPIPRSPWNEIECGGHYARAMSSWGLLLSLSGFSYDGQKQRLVFRPRVTPDRFQSFFTGPEAWGSLAQERDGAEQINTLSVTEGVLPLSVLEIDTPWNGAVSVLIDGKRARHSFSWEPQAAAGPPVGPPEESPGMAASGKLTIQLDRPRSVRQKLVIRSMATQAA